MTKNIDIVKKMLETNYYISLRVTEKRIEIFNTKSFTFDKKDTVIIRKDSINDFNTIYINEVLIFNYMTSLKDSLQIGLKHISLNSNEYIIYDYDKIEFKMCSNVIQYLEAIKMNRNYYKENNSSKPNLIYYRGNKLNYDLSTSLYRNPKLPKLEHIFNNRILQGMPKDFVGCESFFDELTILKHFNCPSRLLDISENPLVAAFFALNNNDDNFGEVHACFIKDYSILKNSKNSDYVGLLSALCTTKKNLYSNTNTIINETHKLIAAIKNYIDSRKDKETTSDMLKIELLNSLNSVIDLIDDKMNDYFSKIDNSFVNISSSFTNFLNTINDHYSDTYDNFFASMLRDSISFKHILENENCFYSELKHQAELVNKTHNLPMPCDLDIDKYFVVQPSLNNDRIKNQQGLFILIGASMNSENSFYTKPNKKYLELFSNGNKRIVFLLDNTNKSFLKDLDIYHGINEGFIYPELEHQIHQILEKVMNEYDNYN